MFNRKKNKIFGKLRVILVFALLFTWLFSGWPPLGDKFDSSEIVKDALAADTGYLSPSANAAVTSQAGDNNGYETNPTYAYASDGLSAHDTNSGANNNSSCDSNGADKHIFYNYNISVPAGSTIEGIEVDQYLAVDSLTDSPFSCVELSWDGGTTWTTAESYSLTSTSLTTYTYGGSSSNWGRTWSISELSNANFQVRIANGDTRGNRSQRDFSLDWIPIRVYYTQPSSLQQVHYRWRNDDGGEAAWYSSNWGYREKITIDHTKISGGADLTSFPILVNRTDTNWRATASGGHVGQTNGNDILFTSADGTTKLDHEIEKYVSTTGELVAWIRIPTLSYSADTVIYIYYGNASAASQQNKTGVWDSNYKLVQHLFETTRGAGVYDDHYGSTVNGNNMEAYSGVDMNGTGKIDGADIFSGSGTNTYLAAASATSLNITDQITISAWINTTSYANAPDLITKGSYTTSYSTWVRADGTVRAALDGNTITTTGTVAVGGWTYVVFTRDSSTNGRKIYLNGTENVSDTYTTAITTNTNPLYVSSSGYPFNGTIDEVRVSNLARSAGWIATEYANQNSPATFYTVSTEAAYSTPATWAAAEDTLLTIDKNTTKRLRFEFSNTAGAATTTTYRLEVSGPDPASCSSATYTRVSSSATWQMTDSTYYTDGDPTINISPGLTDTNTTFVSGKLKDTSDQTTGITLSNTQFTEIEYAVQATASANDGSTYCFRLTNGGSTANITYTVYARATISNIPHLTQPHVRWRNDNGVEAWYNSAWGYREKITIDHTKVSGASALANFAVLINRTDANWRYTGSGGHVGQANGNDLLFTAADGATKLDHEIENYVSSTGELETWVRIPSLSPTVDTVIYLYYGNATCASQQNANGVWDSNYRMVMHLFETAQTAGSSPYNDHRDSTSNGNNGEAMNGTVMSATGKIDGADSFDNVDDYIACGTSNLPNVGASVTLSVWAYYSVLPGTDNLILVDNQSSAAYQLGFRGGNASSWGWGGGVYVSSPQPATGAWHMYTYTYDSSTQTHRLYVDGTNTSTNVTAAQSGTPTLNSINTDRWGENFGGSIDEARISNIARSADWIATNYTNQNSPSTFYSVGSEKAGISANAATFSLAEDTAFNTYIAGNNTRVRLEVLNSGASSNVSAYRLQVAQTATCSSGIYTDVPVVAGSDWQVTDSTYITDGEATENISPGLTDSGTTFVAGQLKDAGNTTGSITLGANNFTEIEFSLRSSLTANGHYCFRLYNATLGAALYTYSNYAEIGVISSSQFNQAAYRFFENQDSASVSTALAAQDTSATLTINNQPFRLRLLIHVSGAALSPGANNFKLQYAAKSGACDTAFAGETYTDVTGVTPIAYYNNPTPTDGSAVTLNPTLDPSHSGHTNVAQSYEEANNFTSLSSILSGQDGLWDFSLVNNSTVSRQSYCLRIVSSDGSVLDTYSVIPEIITTVLFPINGTYISSAFDTATSSAFNILEWTWSKSDSGCTTCDVKLQLETAPDSGGSPGTWNSNWCGPTVCDGTEYYTLDTGELINTIHNGDQWVRYKATFTSDGLHTPILDTVKVYYDHQNGP